ncbi:hypothetical protein SELMODRAFT_403919 [Selaginella moellendorffii]|uniref:Amino acid transporter n=1 Tax=Selaginella moellendorffii TaxID=88036 RepID=D8QSZ5_SELML|nr:excitatory amino acid transporter 4 isoform X1 [Selaginella moellendorffii]EFJ37026.1 hypothetical protein SELMODRAFT_403919 [Selaginella moellendorffii]|eukprot:XP_002961766.1 excitatory amino acid transporter 4 isoform X1 [Selaginella moellendorffii]
MALCRSDTLVWWTLLGVVCGIGLGAALYRAHCSDLTIKLIGYPGELYLRALQQLVLPLIVFALMSGVFSLRHTQHGVGRITRWSLFYYLISMLLAVVVGITLVYLIKPGQSRPFSTTNDKCTRNNITITSVSLQENAAATLVEPLLQIGRDLIPTNFVAAAAKSDYLGMVAFAIVFSFFVNTFGEKADSLVQLVELCNAIIMKIIFAVITLTPIGVASLTANALLKACDVFRLLKALGLFVGTVLGGLMLHSLILLPLMVMLLSRRNPFNALKNFFPALIMGLGTSSGAVTMPVTMNCAVASGCDPNLVRFVIPLGTNINRDGSALYEAVSVLFICQAHGLDLPPAKLFVLAIAATLAAVGCGPVPNSGLLTMIVALQSIGYSQFVGDVSLLYAVDWLLCAVRTSVNIWGDGCACLIVDAWNKRYVDPKSNLEEIREPLLSSDSIDF